VPVKAVVDTNIWISSVTATSEIAANLIDAWKRGRFKVVISEQQTIEIYEVLTRPKFLLKYGITVISLSKFLNLI
jgi:predicted nucleic acid-binding protein